jgi:uncharacterized membrane protein YdbT with pleckstrin-like domain
VQDTIIRPTLKFIRAGAVACGAIAVGLEILYLTQRKDGGPLWPMLLPLLVFAWPLAHWVRRRFTKITISGGRLRYEIGIAARSTRTIQISKIQDVRVDQSITQRLFDVGNLSIETAGEASRLTLQNVDKPQWLADVLMDHAQENPSNV